MLSQVFHLPEGSELAGRSRHFLRTPGHQAESSHFFNTSGLQYKALGLKDKLSTMSEAEQIALLATDGMLVKRPLLIGDAFVLAGFRPADWEAALQ